MVLGFLSQAITVAIGAVYPTFQTFKVIRDGSAVQMVKWLKYWTVFSSFLAADTVADALLLSYIMPGYTFLKFAFLLWTVNPWTNGSEVIFNKVVAPMLATYEQDFDALLSHVITSGRGSLEGIWGTTLDRARRVALAVIWKGASQPLDVYGPRHRAFIRAVEEQDEVDVAVNYDLIIEAQPSHGDAEAENLHEPNVGYVPESVDQPDTSRPVRRGRSRKTASAADLHFCVVTSELDDLSRVPLIFTDLHFGSIYAVYMYMFTNRSQSAMSFIVVICADPRF
ncbi:Uncharacterized protein T19C3.4 [Toxocara canis]|uniref:Receptor expression-enhancing protein n=1 Tax=Toxocara canis TaxID=6265 RepID=A0A0B2V5Y7_TOXCA|nr:Uncharacterized protein T19C3.4 [Toxocara canis]